VKARAPSPWALKVDAPRVGEFPTEDESVIRGRRHEGNGAKNLKLYLLFSLNSQTTQKATFLINPGEIRTNSLNIA
jgi:hypothetical protein